MAKSQSWNVAENPTVAAERAKLFELQGKLAEAKATIEESTAGDGTERSAFDVAVDRELGRDVGEAPAPKLDQGEALQRYRVLAVAVERQGRAVADAEQSAAVETAKAVRPEYEGILRKVKAAVVPLRAALADELSFRQRLFEGGGSLNTVGTCPLPGLTDAGIDRWLAEVEAKHKI